jgi:hypothetical protein
VTKVIFQYIGSNHYHTENNNDNDDIGSDIDDFEFEDVNDDENDDAPLAVESNISAQSSLTLKMLQTLFTVLKFEKVIARRGASTMPQERHCRCSCTKNPETRVVREQETEELSLMKHDVANNWSVYLSPLLKMIKEVELMRNEVLKNKPKKTIEKKQEKKISDKPSQPKLVPLCRQTQIYITINSTTICLFIPILRFYIIANEKISSISGQLHDIFQFSRTHLLTIEPIHLFACLFEMEKIYCIKDKKDFAMRVSTDGYGSSVLFSSHNNLENYDMSGNIKNFENYNIIGLDRGGKARYTVAYRNKNDDKWLLGDLTLGRWREKTRSKTLYQERNIWKTKDVQRKKKVSDNEEPGWKRSANCMHFSVEHLETTIASPGVTSLQKYKHHIKSKTFAA